MDTLVLGAGPVGLLAAHLLGAPCVGERRGGDAELRRLAPTHLWRTPAMEAVLRDLGLPTEAEEVRFGFWGPRGLTDSPTPGERAEYLRRSGRDPGAAPESAISSGRGGRLECFRTSVDALCASLGARVHVDELRVLGILPDLSAGRLRVQVGFGEQSFDLLVNTLPAPTFDGLLRGPWVCRDWPVGRKVFVEGMAWADPLRVARLEGLRWLYVTDPKIPFDRVTVLPDLPGFSYEFNGGCPEWFPEAVNGRLLLDAPLQVLGEPRAEFEVGGLVRNVGRMARWDHRIRLHDVAEALT